VTPHPDLRTEAFQRIWGEAYERDLPLIDEAERIATLRPDLLDDPVSLFETAERELALGARFEAAVCGLAAGVGCGEPADA
jgi:hypothetical protein